MHNYYYACNVNLAIASFMQPRWIVPSRKPKDLEIGWKEICDNSAYLISQEKKEQKRMSDFSGLISTEVAAKIKHNLMYQSSFVYNNVRT